MKIVDLHIGSNLQFLLEQMTNLTLKLIQLFERSK